MNDDYLVRIREDIVFTTNLRGHSLTFHSTWGLFSPREIDDGTELLLRHIEVRPEDDCLDLGCGYGPIGLALAKLAPAGETLMVDKDFIAVEYANLNARLNHVTNARAMLSNAFQHLGGQRFDLIASNVPAKVGKEMLAIMLNDAHAHLRPGGHIWVVTITGLRRLFERSLEDIFGNYEKVKQGKTYTVATAVKMSE
jgi:16S rRNA (guanine1207-N2)-methyltransferase